MSNVPCMRRIALHAALGAIITSAGATPAVAEDSGVRATAPELPPLWLAADAAPGSREELFGDDHKSEAPAASESRGSLFGNHVAEPAKVTVSSWRGYVRSELAYTYASPAHWSRMLVSSEVDNQGSLAPEVKYKIGARIDADLVYLGSDFYPSDVRNDQRFDAFLRENYVDIGAGDWDFRIGRQQIVWGEMVGLFFADVVSAKDLREFILPDFDIIRIPQWAARAEYFKGDFHAEAIWIPVVSYDNIGKPGAEFFPAVPAPPPGFVTQFDPEQFPKKNLSHTNYGLRLSMLKNGWDVSGFYYGGLDAQPTFYRHIDLGPQPALVWQALHGYVDQAGGTLAKDLGPAVLKAEAVYTHGRSFFTTDPTDADGVVAQNTLDLVAGLDFPLPSDTRLNLQVFNRTFLDYNSGLVYNHQEPGFSLLLNHKLNEHLEAEVLVITSLSHTDWMIRPHLNWDFQNNWRLSAGVDIFDGPPLGFFGQFANRDRVYTEVRYSF